MGVSFKWVFLTLIIGLLVGNSLPFILFELDNDIVTEENENTISSEEYDKILQQYNDLQKDYEELYKKYDDLMSDYQKVLGEVPLIPEKPSANLIEKGFEWNYDEKKWSLTLSIPESIYDFYKNQNRPATEDYSIYVTHPFDDEYIKSIIEKINFMSIHEDYTEAERVNLIISFVQSLPYTFDNISTPFDEYPRYPLETLVDGGGDCEDTSILSAALLSEMGYEVILLNLPNHVACGIHIENVYGVHYVYQEKKFYYLETTGEGWKIGEIPEVYKEEYAGFHVLKPVPIITHSWEASWDSTNLEISVNIKNEGTAMAEDHFVYVCFDAGNDQVWNPVQSEPFNLNFGKETSIDLTLVLPTNKNTRLIVMIVDPDGYYVSKSYSEWFNT